MADRGQITRAILDGPLALDNAISKEVARIKKSESVVAGDPDILVVPDLAAGHIHAKQLTFRADNRRAKLDSCAVTCLMASAALVPSPTKTGG
ncbi:phosphate acyltransferase [Accumulibacter sp.]|uniref:phosphate acyltransferase n=1 Tax=Accumulibacter sp. TaxID=2053492 RepID=UPI00261B54F7|nr:phosphate acyltransferase [Accumulibacter sp.]